MLLRASQGGVGAPLPRAGWGPPSLRQPPVPHDMAWPGLVPQGTVSTHLIVATLHSEKERQFQKVPWRSGCSHCKEGKRFDA